ncbi:LOW QUALITY PROTEIN: hypothetical protein T265_14848 [Opisthorchis viverrini]|uniref:Uncharacterized protein n=1 Tax=Opisthorchis viverrini TaxID=6198 RepID=A0A074Z5W9_OPIVI|nr:LOW QUALITY PROTEIN: hypothetical protein T265_14848 [Opisthorchis viverrini]KER22468.1 LOW QUALITY PROTEIN: hypothetical protein T265_14848 [Opisthorchis viverrini]
MNRPSRKDSAPAENTLGKANKTYLESVEKYTHLQINLVFHRDSTESLVYDAPQLNALHTGRLMFQYTRRVFSRPLHHPCENFIVIINDSMTSVFNTDASLPYSHDLFQSFIVKKRIKAFTQAIWIETDNRNATDIAIDKNALIIKHLWGSFELLVCPSEVRICKRVRALCTEEADRTAARIEVKSKLRGSGYPASLIKRQLRRVLAPVGKPNREWIGTAVIPYKPGTSEVIRRILNTANIRFSKGGTLCTGLIEGSPPGKQPQTVYKIKCNDCTKDRRPESEHSRKINRPPRNADEYRALLKDSAIAEHALETGHKILRTCEDYGPRHRLITEAVEITKHPSVNRMEGVELASKDTEYGQRKTLRSVLLHLKDRLPVDRTRNCVYKIKRNNCTKVCIGQTARKLHTRIAFLNRPPRNADKSQAMAGHAVDTGHRIDFENVDILRRGLRFTPQRLVAEAVEIAKHPSVNVWRGILDQPR